jgi:hypothetical protein
MNSWAAALPSPLAPPVMKAIFPSSLHLFIFPKLMIVHVSSTITVGLDRKLIWTNGHLGQVQQRRQLLSI